MSQSLITKLCTVTTLALALSLSACGKVPDDGELKTIQTLVGTSWSQLGVNGMFIISERSLSGNDGCNSFWHRPEEYFIFAPGGTILDNASFTSTKKACESEKTLSSVPWNGWKTYELRDDQLIIKTATGETHTFTHPDPIP